MVRPGGLAVVLIAGIAEHRVEQAEAITEDSLDDSRAVVRRQSLCLAQPGVGRRSPPRQAAGAPQPPAVRGSTFAGLAGHGVMVAGADTPAGLTGPPIRGGTVRVRVMAAAAGAAALAFSLAGGGAAAAAAPRSSGQVVALVLAADSATPLYGGGATGPAVIINGALEAAFTPDGSVAYVTGDDNVTPVSVADTISAGDPVPLPRSHYGADEVAVAVTPDGKTALVVDNFAPYWVSFVSTATNTVIAKVKAGVDPIALAIAPDGRYAYVANVDSGTVTPISIAARRALRPIRVGYDPVDIAITPNGRYAYVVDNGSAAVTPIRLAGNRALRPIRVGRHPAAIAITPDGRHAYVTNNSSGTVSKISLATRRVTATIRTAACPDGIVITPDGKHAYVGSFDYEAINRHLHTVTAIGLASGHTSRIGVGRGPIALAYAAGVVYVADYYSATVTPISVATATAGPPIGLAGQRYPEYIAIRPS